MQPSSFAFSDNESIPLSQKDIEDLKVAATAFEHSFENVSPLNRDNADCLELTNTGFGLQLRLV